jgi:hypothetical protein
MAGKGFQFSVTPVSSLEVAYSNLDKANYLIENQRSYKKSKRIRVNAILACKRVKYPCVNIQCVPYYRQIGFIDSTSQGFVFIFLLFSITLWQHQ